MLSAKVIMLENEIKQLQLKNGEINWVKNYTLA
jgi:hypothetical protein